MIEIPITDEFDAADGRFTNYDTYDPDLREVMREQAHVDIRSLVQTPVTIPTTMDLLDRDLISSLDGETMTQVESPVTVVAGEQWQYTGPGSMAVGPDSARNYWRTLRFTLASGSNVATSSLPTTPIDLTLINGGVLSVSFPGFPLSSVSLSTSSITFTSSSDGTFSDPTQNLSFTLDTSLTPLANDNSEGRWALPTDNTTLGSFDLTSVTGVQITINAVVGSAETFPSPTLYPGSTTYPASSGTPGSATLKVAAIRVLSPNWKYLPIDTDTLYGWLKPTVSRTGLTTAPYDDQFPIIWRSDDPSSGNDPRPVGGSIAATVNTGSLTQTNQISIYMRETPQDILTQLDLEALTQGNLDGNPQPDLGDISFAPRTQDDLDNYIQQSLQSDPQTVLERMADPFISAYIEFVFQWSGTGGTVIARNSTGDGYAFSIGALNPNSTYVMIATLEDTSARIEVYPLDAFGNINVDALIFDSGIIEDDFVFKRRKGRVGWYAQLLDGDAYIDGIRSRGITYAEQRTLPFESLTPVDGAQLFAEFSPDQELVTGVGIVNGANVTPDPGLARSTESAYRVDVTGPYQGLNTNLISFNDFTQTDIRFSIFVPTDAVFEGAKVQAYLTNNAGRTYFLNLGPPVPGQWISHHIPLSVLGSRVQTGSYRLEIVNQSNLGYTYWVDKPISIVERSIQWSGRAVIDDPWKSNDAKWVDFGNQVNNENSGILFYKRGKELQIRARARRQTATIGTMKVKPKYAELGRLVFDLPPSLPLPVANFSTSTSGTSLVFDGSTSTSLNGRIISYFWNFGDGALAAGQTVKHSFRASGTYTVSLTVIDAAGQRASVSAAEVV